MGKERDSGMNPKSNGCYVPVSSSSSFPADRLILTKGSEILFPKRILGPLRKLDIEVFLYCLQYTVRDDLNNTFYGPNSLNQF